MYSNGPCKGVNEGRDDFDRPITHQFSRWFWQRLGATDHFQGRPVQVSITGALYQLIRHDITVGIDHKTQSINALYTSQSRPHRVRFILVQMLHKSATQSLLVDRCGGTASNCYNSGNGEKKFDHMNDSLIDEGIFRP